MNKVVVWRRRAVTTGLLIATLIGMAWMLDNQWHALTEQHVHESIVMLVQWACQPIVAVMLAAISIGGLLMWFAASPRARIHRITSGIGRALRREAWVIDYDPAKYLREQHLHRP